jgi:DNA-binding GntR family transcriptional regulator
MPVETIIEVSSESNKKRRVYEILKNRIVQNDLKPQEYLNEQSICKDLSVSKTPVREALQQLEHNHLVVVVPNKGCFVAPIGIDLIREVFEIREIHECAAARIAAASSSRLQFEEILENHDSLKLNDTVEMRHSLLSGYQIHTAIVEAAGNSFLTEYYRTILAHIVRIRVFFINRFELKRLYETVDEHKQILRAIVDGDPNGAEQAMRGHLHRSIVNINQLTLRNRTVS